MNLAEALDVALVAPAPGPQRSYLPPRLDPGLLVRSGEQDGEPAYSIYQRATGTYFRMEPLQWQLARLFDGRRTYQQIVEAFHAESGVGLSIPEVQQFAARLDDLGFWHRTPQERNLAYSARLAREREGATRSRASNWAHISFSAWDPDRYLTRLDRRIGNAVYNRWFFLVLLLLFVTEMLVLLGNWRTIAHDLPLYYNFTQKSLFDFAEFWVLFLVIGLLHETAHGLSCKHYGGEVHSMGFQLLYLTPAFFVDVTESWISATRAERMLTILAGIACETMLGGVASLLWLATGPGTWLHALSYKVLLLTGVAVIVINLNPLIKLDGYYALTEWLGIVDLKERSTAVLSAWVQRRLFHLPMDMPPVSQRRLPLFLGYALASAAYSYLLLLVVLRFCYVGFAHWSPELAVVITAALALVLFRSRLQALGGLLVRIWQTHAHSLRSPRLRAAAAVLVAVLIMLSVAASLAPVFRSVVRAPCVLHAAQQADVNAQAAGRVAAVLVSEGQTVTAGQVVALLQTDRMALQADRRLLRANTSGAGARQAGDRAGGQAGDQASSIPLRSPIGGIVLTDLTSVHGRYLKPGTPLMHIAGASAFTASVYLPEYEMGRVSNGQQVRILTSSTATGLTGVVRSICRQAGALPEFFPRSETLQGAEMPAYYVVEVALSGDGANLRDGMTGVARIYGKRTSIAATAWNAARGLWRQIVW